jgi:hypothetical protein
MNLEGKDLLSLSALRRFVDERLAGFTIELDEMTGEVIIRSGLTIDGDELFVPLVVQTDDTQLEPPFDRDKQGRFVDFVDGKSEYRTWIASPNGDWWDATHAPVTVHVVHEHELPEDIELEGDKFEDVIMEYGTQVEIPT